MSGFRDGWGQVPCPDSLQFSGMCTCVWIGVGFRAYSKIMIHSFQETKQRDKAVADKMSGEHDEDMALSPGLLLSVPPF